MTSVKETARKNRHNRIRKVISGTAVRPRLVVFRSLHSMYAQIVDDTVGKTLFSTSSLKVKKGTKTEKAKEVGLAISALAIAKGIKEVVFDRNGYRYHGNVKALAEGAREGGLKF